MEDYNKIIESLEIRFIKARNINILKPITIENNYEVENYLIHLVKGKLVFGKNQEVAKDGDIVFIPGGQSLSLTYGSAEPTKLSKEDFISDRDKYLKAFTSEPESEEYYHYVSFEARAFDSVSFFNSLDIPPFIISNNEKLRDILNAINLESNDHLPGSDRTMKVLTELMAIELIRYILNNDLFVEKLATNSTYFKDPRLIDIFTFIKENLADDLSNKVLANVANVSEDYVGQYFKMLTGINPQDYIEYQRMEEAVKLLRTSKKSIRDIGKEVGYKDTAYFCRRFKMMFGIPAGKMRRRESLMNV